MTPIEQAIELPPLPWPWNEGRFTSGQMQDYARAAVEADRARRGVGEVLQGWRLVPVEPTIKLALPALRWAEAQMTSHRDDTKRLDWPAPAGDALHLVAKQAEDEGLWFKAQTAAEAYLQQELRKLHAAIERGNMLERQDREDAERLDWLDEHAHTAMLRQHRDGKWHFQRNPLAYIQEFDSLRAAIDAGRATGGPKKPLNKNQSS